MEQPQPPQDRTCPQCGAQFPMNLLSCPACQTLVHAAELRRLADEAQRAAAANQLSDALAAWRQALELLPPASRQHELISARIIELSRQVDQGGLLSRPPPTPPTPPADGATAAPPNAKSKSTMSKALGALGVVGLLLWKLKAFVLLALSKAKLLLSGLSKGGTFFSMMLSWGLYWSLWGWKFALGFVLSIYIHEMGHVAALRRYGIKATAPMFIPGLGALIRLKQYPATPREDARVGLAGPLWGLGAALACYGLFWATRQPFWAALAQVGAWINLFNLTPIWQLDGGRGFRAFSPLQRGIAVLTIAAAWFLTKEGLLILVMVMAVIRAFRKDAPAKTDSDWTALVQYVVLIAALSAMCLIPVPHGART